MEADLTRLQHIVAIAKERSFVRAAEHLRISQPALSRSIKSFEDKHRVRVFDRSRGGTVPTAAGMQIIREAEKILLGMRELSHNIRLYSEQGAGLIRIVVAPMLSSIILPRLSRLALQGNQHALLDTIIPPLEQMSSLLLDERNEMTFCALRTASGQPGVAVERVGVLETGAFARSGHPLCAQHHVSVADVVEYPILSVTDMANSRIDSKVGGMICSDTAILKEATLQCDGIWIACHSLVGPEIRAGSLQQIHIENLQFEQTEICVAYRQGRTLSHLARTMIDEVRAILAETRAQPE